MPTISTQFRARRLAPILSLLGKSGAAKASHIGGEISCFLIATVFIQLLRNGLHIVTV